MTPAEPDSFSLLRVILAFAVVFGLLGALGFGLRMVAARGLKLPGKFGKAKRLELVESLPLDIRRRLVIVRCDGSEHLLLLGQNQDLVVAQDVTPNPVPLEAKETTQAHGESPKVRAD